MKISIIGSRGIPANYGGFETFAEELSSHLTQNYKDVNVLVLCDCEINDLKESNYKDVKLLYSKYSKANAPLRYYLQSMLMARNSDITIVCGNAIGLFAPLNKFFKSKLLINSDGIEWKRTKWSRCKRLFVRYLEWMAIIFGDVIICDSYGIYEYLNKKYKWKKNLHIIEYGAYINKYLAQNNSQIDNFLEKYNISEYNYHLVVCRLEPENNLDMIIRGYNKSITTKPLVIIGNLLSTKYVKYLKNNAIDNVLFIGGLYDKDALLILRAKAFSYIHGHSVGGTNPSLLEAMGSKNLCICHDNIFNRSTTRGNALFFSNPNNLTTVLDLIESGDNRYDLSNIKDGAFDLIKTYYNWENISNKYYKLITTYFN